MLINIVGTVELFINNMMNYNECIKSIQYQADCGRQEAIGILLWVADVACE